jgi:hypothetical protein
MGSVVILLNRICVVLLLRKESTHCVISTGILRLRMLWTSRLWCMLKAPATSISIAENTFPSFQFIPCRRSSRPKLDILLQ